MIDQSVVGRVKLDLAEHFADLDDSEDAPFGEYARVIDLGNGQLMVLHETEPWGLRVTVEPVDENGDPYEH